MKLTNVRVRMFRNILDSGDVEVQGDVTSLVGKNESGKTAFLQALWRLKPARVKASFDIPSQYPAWLEKKHRNGGQVLEKVEPISATFQIETADADAITKRFGEGVAKINDAVTISRQYDNSARWIYSFDEKRAVSNVLDKVKLKRDTKRALKSPSTFEALHSAIDEAIEDDSSLSGELQPL